MTTPAVSTPARRQSSSDHLQGTVRRGVTVVAPVFNERECADAILQSLTQLSADCGDRYELEIIVVDDGSSDGTAEIFAEQLRRRHGIRLVRHRENQGIAAAIHTGIRSASFETVVSIDADGSYDFRLIPTMVDHLQDDVAVVTASPYHPEGDVQNVASWRIGISKAASLLYRLALRQKLSCYTSCFRVYRRSTVLPLAPRDPRFVGVAELLWHVDQAGEHIVECPAVLSVRAAGRSKMRVGRVAVGHLMLISRILLRRAAGRPAQATSHRDPPVLTD